MNSLKKFSNIKCFTLTISILIISFFTYFYYTSYVQTIKINVPVFGKIDTGITDYQLSQFKKAQKEYDQMKLFINKRYHNRTISEKQYKEQMAQISFQYLSDNRITAIISGPAKKFVNFLVK